MAVGPDEYDAKPTLNCKHPVDVRVVLGSDQVPVAVPNRPSELTVSGIAVGPPVGVKSVVNPGTDAVPVNVDGVD
jgi:hypothetical protein